jgi:hypothetical protein
MARGCCWWARVTAVPTPEALEALGRERPTVVLWTSRYPGRIGTRYWGWMPEDDRPTAARGAGWAPTATEERTGRLPARSLP